MKSHTKHPINPVAKPVILEIALTETKAKLIIEGARFHKMDLRVYIFSALIHFLDADFFGL